MAAETLIDSHVSEHTTSVAINALLAHTLKRRKTLEDSELLPPKEDHVYLVVATKRVPKSSKVKPLKIPLAHPLIDPRETSICLLTKDPQREYKDLLAEKSINFISRVVGVTKLRGKHKPFEARRQLLKDHGLFLADQRIVPLLPDLLGKMFFDAKKQPVPVDLTRKDLKSELARAVSSTYMHQNAGTCLSIKISSLTHTPEQVVANFIAALPAVVKNIEGGWDNVLSVSVKTGRSMSMPLWSCELSERFKVPALDEAAKGAEGEKKGKAKGTKRKASEADVHDAGVTGGEEPEKKKKKASEPEDVALPDSEEEEFTGFSVDDDEEAPAPVSLPKPSKAKKTKAAPSDADGISGRSSSLTSNERPSKPTKTKKSAPRTSGDGLDAIPLVPSLLAKPKKAKTKYAAAEEGVVESESASALPAPVDAAKKASKKTSKAAPSVPKERAPKSSSPSPEKKSKKQSASATAASSAPAPPPVSEPTPLSTKADKPKKKGESVLALEKKVHKGGKVRTTPSGKEKLLGKKK